MKQCKACGGRIRKSICFRPTDGQSLVQSEQITLSEFHLTLISEMSLIQRLFFRNSIRHRTIKASMAIGSIRSGRVSPT